MLGAEPRQHPLDRVGDDHHALRRAPRTETSSSATVAGRGRRWKSAIRRAVIVRSQTWNSPSRGPVERRLDRAHQHVGRHVLDRRLRAPSTPPAAPRCASARRPAPRARPAPTRARAAAPSARTRSARRRRAGPARPLPARGTRGDRIECGACARRSRLNEVAVPAFELTGAHDGPRLSLIGGVHGCEYSSIAAVIDGHARARPAASCSGRITAVPVVSMDSFTQALAVRRPRRRQEPQPRVPGRPRPARYTDRLAHDIHTTADRARRRLHRPPRRRPGRGARAVRALRRPGLPRPRARLRPART